MVSHDTGWLADCIDLPFNPWLQPDQLFNITNEKRVTLFTQSCDMQNENKNMFYYIKLSLRYIQNIFDKKDLKN